MKCPHCGKEIDMDAELAKIKKAERLTREEKEKNKAYYAKLEADSYRNRVLKTKLTDKDFKNMVAGKAALLKGHLVFSCDQEYLCPSDPDRARKGLQTDLITATRNWIEVDGRKIHTNATAEEIKNLLSSPAETASRTGVKSQAKQKSRTDRSAKKARVA